MNAYWVRLASWHIVDTLHRGEGTKTLCGRVTDQPQQEERPARERTCESCLRRQVEHEKTAEKRDDGQGN